MNREPSVTKWVVPDLQWASQNYTSARQRLGAAHTAYSAATREKHDAEDNLERADRLLHAAAMGIEVPADELT